MAKLSATTGSGGFARKPLFVNHDYGFDFYTNHLGETSFNVYDNKGDHIYFNDEVPSGCDNILKVLSYEEFLVNCINGTVHRVSDTGRI